MTNARVHVLGAPLQPVLSYMLHNNQAQLHTKLTDMQAATRLCIFEIDATRRAEHQPCRVISLPSNNMLAGTFHFACNYLCFVSSFVRTYLHCY
jgi:hypothetical protein